MRKWMTFSYTTNVRAHAGVTLQKIKANKLNQNNVCHVPFTMFVCFFICLSCTFCLLVRFFMCLSYTICLAVRFNCIKRAVFKPLIFPAYSTNIVIVIFHKWPTFIKRPRPPLCSEWFAFIVIFNLC